VDLSFGKWWKRRSGGAKTVVALAVLLILQIGLCFSSDLTVIPAYEAIFAVVQAMLCAVTGVALLVAFLGVVAGGGF